MSVKATALAAVAIIGFVGGIAASVSYYLAQPFVESLHIVLAARWLVSGVLGAAFAVLLILVYLRLRPEYN
ncbi:MAG: hypothetical protein QW767_04765 [Thermoprotei archaeon]